MPSEACIHEKRDTAISRADLHAPMGMAADEGKVNMFITRGIYRDTFVRTSEGWRITSRTLDRVWVAPGPQGVSGPIAPTS
jgi:hypothetical protein